MQNFISYGNVIIKIQRIILSQDLSHVYFKLQVRNELAL